MQLNPTVRQKSSNLIFVEFTVFEFGFSLFTEGDDDETHEDVHHEEGDDDDVDDEEDGDLHPVIIDRTVVHSIGINSFVQEPRSWYER